MIDLSTIFLFSPILRHLRYMLGGACSILAAVKDLGPGRKAFWTSMGPHAVFGAHDKSFSVNKLDFVRR